MPYIPQPAWTGGELHASTGPIIETPRGKVIVTAELKAELIWNPNFKPKWQKRYSRAQWYVDNEILHRCDPYIPLRTGMLIKSGQLGTEIGSGTVKWIAPYARPQYYRPNRIGSETGPLRGPQWFERWKQVGARGVITEARKIAGSGA